MAAVAAVVLAGTRAEAAAGDVGGRQTPFVAQHYFEAQVTKVDPGAGTLTVKTDSGRLLIEAPAATTSALEKGDPVLLEIRLFATGVAIPSEDRPPRLDAGDVLVRRRLDAQITRIEPRVGRLTLKIPAGVVALNMPGEAMKAFNERDVIPIELRMLRPPPGQAIARDEQDRSRRAGWAALLFSIFGKRGNK